MSETNLIRKKTIKDFNNQWKLQGDLNDDYWASSEIILDQFNEVYPITNIDNKVVGDIGAGTGRLVKTFLDYNPKKIYAVEPSTMGMGKLRERFDDNKKIELINSDGLNFKTSELCDTIFSIGVIHHIKNPVDVLVNIRKNLKKNGKIVIWVYGYENNLLYIIFYKIISIFSKYIPDRLLYIFANLLNLILVPYIALCSFFNLPLKKYLLNVFYKCGWKKRNDIIFDQLNPEYAKYYKKEEIIKELQEAGYSNIQSSHRHEYSWALVGENN